MPVPSTVHALQKPAQVEYWVWDDKMLSHLVELQCNPWILPTWSRFALWAMGVGAYLEKELDLAHMCKENTGIS